jgi:hypothetical protein
MIAPEITVDDHVDPTLDYPDEFEARTTAYFAHIGAATIQRVNGACRHF